MLQFFFFSTIFVLKVIDLSFFIITFIPITEFIQIFSFVFLEKESQIIVFRHFLYIVVVVQPLSCVQLFATPWTVAHQAPLSMGFPRQEYWSGLPFSSPVSLPDSGIEPESSTLAGRFFTTEPPGKVFVSMVGCRLWGRTELDTTEVTQQQQQHCNKFPSQHLFMCIPEILT